MLPAQFLTADLQNNNAPAYIYLNVTVEGTHTGLTALWVLRAEQITWHKQAWEENKQHGREKSKTWWG